MCYRASLTVRFPTDRSDVHVFASPLYVDELGEMHPR